MPGIVREHVPPPKSVCNSVHLDATEVVLYEKTAKIWFYSEAQAMLIRMGQGFVEHGRWKSQVLPVTKGGNQAGGPQMAVFLITWGGVRMWDTDPPVQWA